MTERAVSRWRLLLYAHAIGFLLCRPSTLLPLPLLCFFPARGKAVAWPDLSEDPGADKAASVPHSSECQELLRTRRPGLPRSGEDRQQALLPRAGGMDPEQTPAPKHGFVPQKGHANI